MFEALPRVAPGGMMRQKEARFADERRWSKDKLGQKFRELYAVVLGGQTSNVFVLG